MKSIKNTIEDYIAEFKFKSRSEKIRSIKILTAQLVVIVGLICAPPIISKLHSLAQEPINARRLPELTMDEKWDLVRMGRLHVECVDGTDETLRKLGFDPTSAVATNYALDHDLCGFHMN